jgi:TPR repeat protein
MEEDLVEALTWLRESARQGDAHAQLDLGRGLQSFTFQLDLCCF